MCLAIEYDFTHHMEVNHEQATEIDPQCNVGFLNLSGDLVFDWDCHQGPASCVAFGPGAFFV